MNNWIAMALLAASLTQACAPSPMASIVPSGPLMPASLVANSIVLLEDSCEDPVDDLTTLTTAEAVADMFALPWTMVIMTARLAAYPTVGLAMVLSGTEARAAIDKINWVLPLLTAGPNPDLVHYSQITIIEGWGCHE